MLWTYYYRHHYINNLYMDCTCLLRKSQKCIPDIVPDTNITHKYMACIYIKKKISPYNRWFWRKFARGAGNQSIRRTWWRKLQVKRPWLNSGTQIFTLLWIQWWISTSSAELSLIRINTEQVTSNEFLQQLSSVSAVTYN